MSRSPEQAARARKALALLTHLDQHSALAGLRPLNPGNSPPCPSTYSDEERVDLLVKAGALIAAEIDRLLRKARRAEKKRTGRKPRGRNGR